MFNCSLECLYIVARDLGLTRWLSTTIQAAAAAALSSLNTLRLTNAFLLPPFLTSYVSLLPSCMWPPPPPPPSPRTHKQARCKYLLKLSIEANLKRRPFLLFERCLVKPTTSPVTMPDPVLVTGHSGVLLEQELCPTQSFLMAWPSKIFVFAGPGDRLCGICACGETFPIWASERVFVTVGSTQKDSELG